MNNNDPRGFIELMVGLLTVITSPEIARLVGPYVAIMLAAVVGAGLALGRADAMRPVAALWYVGIRVLAAMLLAVAIAQAIRKWFPNFEPNVTLIPVALGIGYIKDYNRVAEWVGDRVKAMVPGQLRGTTNDGNDKPGGN